MRCLRAAALLTTILIPLSGAQALVTALVLADADCDATGITGSHKVTFILVTDQHAGEPSELTGTLVKNQMQAEPCEDDEKVTSNNTILECNTGPIWCDSPVVSGSWTAKSVGTLLQWTDEETDAIVADCDPEG